MFVLHILQHGGDFTQFGLHAGGGGYGLAAPVGHHRAPVNHVLTVGQGKIAVRQLLGIFLHRFGFAGQGRFLNFEICRDDKSGIGRHDVPGFDQEDVSRHQVLGRNLLLGAVAPHPHVGYRHFFEGRHGVFGLEFLPKPQHRIEHHNDENHDGIDIFLQRRRNDHGGQQYQDHDFLHLGQQDPPGFFSSLLDQFVGAVLVIAAARFFGSKAHIGRLQFLYNRSLTQLVPVSRYVFIFIHGFSLLSLHSGGHRLLRILHRHLQASVPEPLITTTPSGPTRARATTSSPPTSGAHPQVRSGGRNGSTASSPGTSGKLRKHYFLLTFANQIHQEIHTDPAAVVCGSRISDLTESQIGFVFILTIYKQ